MRKIEKWSWLALLATCCFSAGAAAQPLTPDALLQPYYDFENEMTPWAAIGDEAKLSLARGAGEIKVGQGALRLDYGVRAGKINALILPTPLHGLSDTKSLSFWIKADYQTTLAALFQEREGGRYAALFHARANEWQRVELEFSDFLLLEGGDDPQDPNGKLDISQIEALSIADMGQIFAGVGDAKMVEMLGLQPGPHSLIIDDFLLSRDALPLPVTVAPKVETAIKPETAEKPVVLEPLRHPQIAWMPLGGAQLSIETAANLPGRSLQIKSVQKAGSLSGLLRRLPRGVLRDAREIRFEATSLTTSTLLVQLEETGGGKYQTTARISGGDLVNPVALEIAQFRLSDDAKDANNRLDLNQVIQIGILDITGLLETAGAENTWVLNNLRATR